MSDVYAWTGARGFSTLGEHVLIHGVPVQFLPAHNPLVEEASWRNRHPGVRLELSGAVAASARIVASRLLPWSGRTGMAFHLATARPRPALPDGRASRPGRQA